MVIEPRVVQFWSEIILVISNHAYDFSPNCTPLSSITIIYKVVDIFVGCTSTFTLTTIALERAFSVWLPHVHRHVRSNSYYGLPGLIWLLSILVSCLRFLFEEKLLSLPFFFYFMLVSFSVALSIICISYVVI